MSLTYLLTSEYGRPLREKLKLYFPKPAFKFKLEIKVPPGGTNNRIIGAAFDYAFRNYLKNKYAKIKIKICGPIEHIHTKAFNKLISDCKSNDYIPIRRRLSFAGSIVDSKIIHNRLLFINAKSLRAEKKYLKDGTLTETYLQAMFYFAHMDLFYRSGFLYDEFDKFDRADKNELKSLIQNINFELFKAKKVIHLNPSFGIATEMAQGADADLIVDDNLIDIKVTKELKLQRQHFNQLLGYYFLSLIGFINGNSRNLPISKISIYFARHAALWECPILLNFDKDQLDKFTKWFYKFLNPAYKRKKKNKPTTNRKK